MSAARETSFPFMSVARDCGVPYATVLACSDAFEQRRTEDLRGFLDLMNYQAFVAVEVATLAEQERRAKS